MAAPGAYEAVTEMRTITITIHTRCREIRARGATAEKAIEVPGAPVHRGEDEVATSGAATRREEATTCEIKPRPNATATATLMPTWAGTIGLQAGCVVKNLNITGYE